MMTPDPSGESHSCVTDVLSADGLDLVADAEWLDDTYAENEGLDGGYACPTCDKTVAIHFDAALFWEETDGDMQEVSAP